MGLEEKSYKIHEHSFDQIEIDKELRLYRNWFDNPTTDLWRHLRMLSVLDTFLENHKQASWLTIGDGRFGTSAIYLERRGGKALPTDIDIQLLEVARQNSMINDFAYANAEKLPFDDEEFDYTYCKQSYHHFPRPALAVYEMLRVARKAVIFTEPHDFMPTPFMRRILQKIKHTLKKISGRNIAHHDTGNYEPIGNYIYGISVREFEKIALGMGLPALAYKRFDDIYIEGVEREKLSPQAKLFRKIKWMMLLRTIGHFFGLSYPNTIQMILFKILPHDKILRSLKEQGYTIVRFSVNPYL